MWPRGARYAKAGDVLSTQWFRSLARTKSDRGGTRIFRRSGQTRVRRSRRVGEDKRIRSSRKVGAVSNEGERSAATAALRGLPQWRAHWGSNKRHAFSKLELGHRHGVCVV